MPADNGVVVVVLLLMMQCSAVWCSVVQCSGTARESVVSGRSVQLGGGGVRGSVTL